jgi:hypothetical protein
MSEWPPFSTMLIIYEWMAAIFNNVFFFNVVSFEHWDLLSMLWVRIWGARVRSTQVWDLRWNLEWIQPSSTINSLSFLGNVSFLYCECACILFHFCLCISWLLVASNSLSQPWILGFLFKLHFAYKSWSNLSRLSLGFQEFLVFLKPYC